MQSILRISEGAVIALHTADYLAGREGLSPATGIAKALRVSYNHLSKVLQQLTRAGLIAPVRGPKGGFALSPSGRKARVRDVVSAIDGPPAMGVCLMKRKVCGHRDCLLGGFLAETNKRFEEVLNARISDLARRK